MVCWSLDRCVNVKWLPHGIECIVLAGMLANTCVELTGRYAVKLGYDVTFLKDAVGATSWEAQRAAIEVNYPRYASAILTVDEFLESLSEKSESWVRKASMFEPLETATPKKGRVFWIGHSFGGLYVQLLLDRDLGRGCSQHSQLANASSLKYLTRLRGGKCNQRRSITMQLRNRFSTNCTVAIGSLLSDNKYSSRSVLMRSVRERRETLTARHMHRRTAARKRWNEFDGSYESAGVLARCIERDNLPDWPNRHT